MPPKRKRSSSGVGAAAGGNVVPEEEQGGEDLFGGGSPLVESECPFSVEYKSIPTRRKKGSAPPSGSRKAKRYTKSGMPVNPVGQSRRQQDIDREAPEDSTIYAVKPRKQWDQLKKYRNFVVGTENFALNEYIFVNHSNIPHGTNLAAADDHKFWVARVLEIRAVDEAHVYLRVYWLYWPEELPAGRQPYHGAKELVASNHMEIIDAMTVSGRALVKHWYELDEDEDLPDLFWRQKFDYPTQTLMEVREHCKCRGYYNPDRLMFACTHCKTWLHEDCLVADIRKTLHGELVESGPPSPTPQAPATNDDNESEANGQENESEKGLQPKTPSSFTRKFRPRRTTEPLSTPASANKSASKTQAPKSSGKSKDDAVTEVFQITIRPEPNGPVKAAIKDLRPKAELSSRGARWDEPVHCLLCMHVIS